MPTHHELRSLRLSPIRNETPAVSLLKLEFELPMSWRNHKLSSELNEKHPCRNQQTGQFEKSHFLSQYTEFYIFITTSFSYDKELV